jgi:hypothetical protein
VVGEVASFEVILVVSVRIYELMVTNTNSIDVLSGCVKRGRLRGDWVNQFRTGVSNGLARLGHGALPRVDVAKQDLAQRFSPRLHVGRRAD